MLQLGDEYLNCLMIYKDGLFLSPTYEPMVRAYIKDVNANRNNSVVDWNNASIWCDLTITKSLRDTRDSMLLNLFSAEQYRETKFGKGHNFSDSKDSWLSSKWAMKNFVINNLPNKKIVQNKEIIISPSPKFEDLSGKSVLIVGGGPSTRDCSWEKMSDKFDFIWSSNEFYLNQKLQNQFVSFSTMAPGFDLVNNKTLIEHIENKNLKMWFEIERGDDIKEWQYLKQFVNKYPHSCGVFNTRYRSCSGVGNRMVILAIMLGATKIGIVGIDGSSAIDVDGNLKHAFNGNKKLPNWIKIYREDSPRLQERQYLIYWEYITQLQQDYNFEIYNLGEGHPDNVSTAFTERLFPLNKTIKDVVQYKL